MNQDDNHYTETGRDETPSTLLGIIFSVIARVTTRLPGGWPGLMVGCALGIGALLLVVLGLIGLMTLFARFQFSPVGQVVGTILALTVLVLSLAMWFNQQTRSRWKLGGLFVIALGLAVVVWLLIRAGILTETNFEFAAARFRANPLTFTTTLLLLLLMIIGMLTGIVYSVRRFVHNAYSSPLRFVLALAQIIFWVLLIVIIVWLLGFSGLIDLDPITLPTPQVSPAPGDGFE